MIKVLELKNSGSMAALNLYTTLLIGLKHLPEHYLEDWEDYFARIEAMDKVSLENFIRRGAMIVQLESKDIEGALRFVADPNGVPYSPANIKNLGLKDIFEMVVAIALEVASLEINFVTEAEKKN